MDAPTVWICIPRTHKHEVSQNSGFTQSSFGSRHRSLRNENAPAWTETVTRVSYEHVRDDVYDLARRYFSEKELVDLTRAIIAINGWNRLAISFRAVPATHQRRSQSGDTTKIAHSDGISGTPTGQARSVRL